MNQMLVVDIDYREYKCHLCNSPTCGKFGVPMYEDMVLPNNCAGKWFGQTACETCFLAQNKIRKPINLNRFATLIKNRVT